MRKFPIIAVSAGAVAVPLLVLLAFTFIRPYDVPEFVEVDSSESAFLIPLEGDTANQAAFHSVKFLEEKKIATKRVQITHRWQQMGYLPRSGNYVATVRLVKVDRRPITREWTKSPKTGTSPKDEAIAVESKESVNFSMGLSCTAHIPEESAAVFLYSYPSKSLSEMLDMEVRARIHQIIAEEAGTYNVFDLPAKKNEIMKAVRDDVVPFFKKKGIEITTLAMLGGLTFDNAEIQRAIDDAAKASHLKVAAEAKRSAQEVENKTLLLAADGKATAAKREAQGKLEVELVRIESEAKIRIREAEGQAEAIRRVADARAYEAQKVNEQPETYLRLRMIEAEMLRWKQWDGRYPQYVLQMGGGASSSPIGVMLPPLPGPMAHEALKTVRTEEKK
jgi:regulator of protease activity HflC (stomatin/prohibitin superfamily)